MEKWSNYCLEHTFTLSSRNIVIQRSHDLSSELFGVVKKISRSSQFDRAKGVKFEKKNET